MYSEHSSERVKTELAAIIATPADLEDRPMHKQDQLIVNGVVLVAMLRATISFKSIVGKQNRHRKRWPSGRKQLTAVVTKRLVLYTCCVTRLL
jgi:hypothetical protein